ncbi:hypothetical protein ACWD9K_34850 [Streptomyces sp. 900116325]
MAVLGSVGTTVYRHDVPAGAVLAEATLRKVAVGAAGTVSEAAAPEPLAPEKAAGEVTA